MQIFILATYIFFELFVIFRLVPEIAIKSYNTIQYDLGHPVLNHVQGTQFIKLFKFCFTSSNPHESLTLLKSCWIFYQQDTVYSDG